MGLNFGHFKKLQGILKLVGIIVVLCAAALGTGAFVNSEYNKTCRNNDPLPPAISTEGSGDASRTDPGITRTTLRWRTTTTIPPSIVKKNGTSGQHEKIQSIETFESSTSATLETTTDEDEEKDMAPVLWMERFHLSVCYTALLGSLVLLVLSIVSKDLEYSKIFKAINFTYHFVWCILLIVSSIFMGYAAMEIDRQVCQVRAYESRGDCQKYWQKMIAAGLSVITAILHGMVSYLIVSTKLYEQV